VTKPTTIFFNILEAAQKKGLQNAQLQAYYQQQLPVFFTFCDVNHQCQAMSELS
jgi:hypothetical protein